MNIRLELILTGLTCLAVSIIVIFTKMYMLIGLPIGLITGFANADLLFWFIDKISGKPIQGALLHYILNLIFRLCMIAAVIVVIAKLQPAWVLCAGVGIFAGVVISIMLSKQQLIRKEGGEKNA